MFQCFRDYLCLNKHKAIKTTDTMVVKLQATPALPPKGLYGTKNRNECGINYINRFLCRNRIPMHRSFTP